MGLKLVAKADKSVFFLVVNLSVIFPIDSTMKHMIMIRHIAKLRHLHCRRNNVDIVIIATSDEQTLQSQIK